MVFSPTVVEISKIGKKQITLAHTLKTIAHKLHISFFIVFSVKKFLLIVFYKQIAIMSKKIKNSTFYTNNK